MTFSAQFLPTGMHEDPKKRTEKWNCYCANKVKSLTEVILLKWAFSYSNGDRK